jgi:hypothetical protein
MKSRFDNKEDLDNVSYRPQIPPLAMLLIEKSRHSKTSSLSHRSFSTSAQGPSQTTTFQAPPALLPEMAVILSYWILIESLGRFLPYVNIRDVCDAQDPLAALASATEPPMLCLPP